MAIGYHAAHRVLHHHGMAPRLQTPRWRPWILVNQMIKEMLWMDLVGLVWLQRQKLLAQKLLAHLVLMRCCDMPFKALMKELPNFKQQTCFCGTWKVLGCCHRVQKVRCQKRLCNMHDVLYCQLILFWIIWCMFSPGGPGSSDPRRDAVTPTVPEECEEEPQQEPDVQRKSSRRRRRSGAEEDGRDRTDRERDRDRDRARARSHKTHHRWITQSFFRNCSQMDHNSSALIATLSCLEWLWQVGSAHNSQITLPRQLEKNTTACQSNAILIICFSSYLRHVQAWWSVQPAAVRVLQQHLRRADLRKEQLLCPDHLCVEEVVTLACLNWEHRHNLTQFNLFKMIWP